MNPRNIISMVLAVLAAATAHAQSKIEIYGVVDTGYVKESGSDARMDSNEDSTLGIRGTEDLGNGLKATFQLEKRFFLHDGTAEDDHENFDDKLHHSLLNRSAPDWQGAANVGLKGEWGAVQLGRVYDLAVESYEEFDPFHMHSTGAALSRYSRIRSEMLSNTMRYDSPSWRGLGLAVTYTLRGDDSDALVPITNHGFAGIFRYQNGPFLMSTVYSRLADSNRSYTWNAGLAYAFGPTTVSLGFHHSRLRDLKNLGTLHSHHPGEFDALKQQEWLMGLRYEMGPHTLKGAYSYGRLTGRERRSQENGHVNKLALGYVYTFSKRTDLYAVASFTRSSNDYVGEVYNNNDAARTSVAGVQLGMTHKF